MRVRWTPVRQLTAISSGDIKGIETKVLSEMSPVLKKVTKGGRVPVTDLSSEAVVCNV